MTAVESSRGKQYVVERKAQEKQC